MQSSKPDSFGWTSLLHFLEGAANRTRMQFSELPDAHFAGTANLNQPIAQLQIFLIEVRDLFNDGAHPSSGNWAFAYLVPDFWIHPLVILSDRLLLQAVVTIDGYMALFLAAMYLPQGNASLAANLADEAIFKQWKLHTAKRSILPCGCIGRMDQF